MQVALNGNSSGLTDPNFIHFDEEQAGTLLPPPPGYPVYLPQLQISPKGRLCFWNFPNKIFQSLASNPANKGTSNYLRDSKAVTAANPYPPIPGDLGTNGKTNQYFWGACNSEFIVQTDFANEFVFQLASRMYWGDILTNPTLTLQEIVSGMTAPGSAYMIPKAGKLFSASGLKLWGPWDWIEYNAQYYINQFLVRPYDISAGPQYGDNWTGTLSKESAIGALPTWLNATNFFVQLTANPDFLQQVSNAAPIAILSAVALVSGGLATPALAAVVATGTGAIASQVKKANVVAAQQQTITNALQAGGATNLTESLAVYNLTSGEVTFFIISFLVIILILIFYHKK
jgi:hypothetical protein